MATRQRAHSQEDSRKQNQSLRDFQGINTQAYRTSIGDDQFAWLENVMPIGFGNMVVPPGPTTALTSWSGDAYHMRNITLNNTPYLVVFTVQGAVYAVNLNTYATTTVAAAGTLSGNDSEICQWDNTQAIMVDTTGGYYSWDGTTLTKWNGKLQTITVTDIGLGYTSVPTIGGFTSGGGTGGAATCDIQVGAVTAIASAGTGYQVGDVLTFAGGTFTTAAQAIVSSINTSTGAITGLNLSVTGDYTIAPGNPVSVTGGYGTSATFTLNFGIGPITLTNLGSGYTAAPTLTVTGGGGTGGAVSAAPSVVPDGGTSCATYAGRVWVSKNRTVSFSAPGSFSDFTTVNAGGSFVMSDETLIGDIVAVRSANNFLYIFGTSSVNVVSDVAVVAGVTVFSNTNISATIGTEYEDSIIPYYRAMCFANDSGIYALYGTTTQKISDELDGIFPLLTRSVEITAGTVMIFEILCLCFLAKYADPIAGERSLLFVHFNKKWFLASQGDALVNIETSMNNGVQSLYGTDGTSLYQLFGDANVATQQIITTKLWDMGEPLRDKQVLKFALELISPGTPQTIVGYMETENKANAVSFSLVSGNVVQWINYLGNIVEWVNVHGDIVQWINSGYSFQNTDVATTGKYIGVTLTGSSIGTIYSALHMQYELRADW